MMDVLRKEAEEGKRDSKQVVGKECAPGSSYGAKELKLDNTGLLLDKCHGQN